jgi:hypothetical protein
MTESMRKCNNAAVKIDPQKIVNLKHNTYDFKDNLGLYG